jgi:hypothetical protein
MRGLDQLPGPIVVGAPLDLPSGFGDFLLGTCALCGADVRFHPRAPVDRSLICLLCFIVRADPELGDLYLRSRLLPDVPTC